MSKKKNKFDFSYLVQSGYIKDGQVLYFVSDPGKTCKVAKQPTGEYKVTGFGETMTLFAFAQKCLGQEPPDHASKWVRDEKGTSLFDYWHAEDYAAAA